MVFFSILKFIYFYLVIVMLVFSLRLLSVFKNYLLKPSIRKLQSLLHSHHKEYFERLILLLNFRSFIHQNAAPLIFLGFVTKFRVCIITLIYQYALYPVFLSCLC